MRIKIFLLVLTVFQSCSSGEDIKTPELVQYLFYEEFLSNSQAGIDINMEGWTNFAQVGTVKWKQGIYSRTKYAVFSGYQSGETSNVAWLISPPINMDAFEKETLAFDVAQAYVSSVANSLELFVSTDYDGTNVTSATWIEKSFPSPPLVYESNYVFYSSGLIDLSEYTGNIYLAFKATGSGTNTSLDGTYEIDNIRIFDKP